MTAGRVTLLDVARRAGVSRTTASFVLTGRRDMRISADAEQRVLRAARELDYRPNLTARSLRTRVTQTIGLVSDTIATDAFAGEIIRGSTATALTRQHLLFIGETEGDPATEQRLIQDMLDRGVDGFLYAAMYTREIRIPSALRGHPVVLVNCVAGGRRAVSVVPDELAAGRSAASALLAAGHTGGIHIVGESAAHVYAARNRRTGIDETLAAAGLRVAGTVECSWWPEPAYEAVRAFLAGGPRATALICLNDRLAMGAYQAAASAGLRIPDDLSVVAFDDSDLASWLRPQLTSVALPHFELGRRAVELLLDPDREPGTHLVDMPLRSRASIAPPRLP
ncbi:LacI family DNA-binding transcriptional regulator [Dactylosporangium sp. NPDC049742]|uniref:LacI family DNA-binding transcriptional regulator n=1 Tax=Dactylosporangium sp. NPDC049742 TaxID=3154737 RepID=UPI00344A6956